MRGASALAILLAYAALHWWWLPPDGFFSGDAGTKYLQARAVVEHGPFRPWIEGPSLALDTALRWQEPFLLAIDGHLVGVFSWLLATLTAPFLALFGLRGLYVVPALSIAVVFLATCAIGRAAGQRWSGMLSGWTAVLATPIVFYGAELWEHAPAIALSTAGIALMFGPGAPMWRRAAAGACFVLAGALRPEALFVPLAALLARAWVIGPRKSLQGTAALLAGATIAGLATLAMNIAVYGTVIPQQVSSNLHAAQSYWDVRRQAIETLVLPPSYGWLVVVALMLLAAASMVQTLRTRLWLAHVAIGLVLAAAIGVPVWLTVADGTPLDAAFGTLNLSQTWPALAVIGYAVVDRDRPPIARILLLTVGAIFAGVFVAMPHTGGAQWSARFFLPAAPLAAVLAAQALERKGTRALAAVTIAVSIAVQVYGLAHLRQNKRITSQIARMTASMAAPGDLVISDLFWFPQVTATIYPTRAMLYARANADIELIAAQAATRGIDSFWLATSSPKGNYPPFVATTVREAGVAGLLFQRFVRK